MVKVEKDHPYLEPPPERRKGHARKDGGTKKGAKKYMASFVEIKVRMTQERRTTVQEHAQAMGESATAFINRAISETMERDSGPSEQPEGGE